MLLLPSLLAVKKKKPLLQLHQHQLLHQHLLLTLPLQLLPLPQHLLLTLLLTLPKKLLKLLLLQRSKLSLIQLC